MQLNLVSQVHTLDYLKFVE